VCCIQVSLAQTQAATQLIAVYKHLKLGAQHDRMKKKKKMTQGWVVNGVSPR
jgi:hypothetical protein